MVGGEILHYQRTVKLYSAEARKKFARFSGVSDIMRIHLWRWVRTFDSTKKQLRFWGEKGEVDRQKLARVYALYTAASIESDMGRVWYHHRILLNRRGIVSIEELEL